MKLISNVFTFLSLSTVVAAELHFQPGGTQRALLRGGDLNGLWGQFAQEGSCVEKIQDPDDTTSDKVKFAPCDNTNPAQMWKFDKFDESVYSFGGLLYNMEGGCLAIRGDVAEGKNLKVVECDRNNAKQHWLSGGDNLSPRDSRELCVSPESYPIENKDPVTLLDCDGTGSLDY